MLKHESLIRDRPESFKNRIFRIFHHVIHEYSIPRTLYITLIIVEALQMLLYCLHPSFVRVWDSPFIIYLQTVLTFLDLSGLWQVGGFVATIIWSILIFLIGAATVLVILWEVKECKGKINTK